MKDFYIQRKYFNGWGTSKSTERGILYTINNYDRDNIGLLGSTRWYIKSPPYDVMIKLRVKPV